MPNSKYTSDLIIATGNISRWYARNYLSYLAIELMKDDFWKNQIVQINILPDLGVELVPRVGEHIVYLGNIPQTNMSTAARLLCKVCAEEDGPSEEVYKYGLSQAGWNKYSYIDLEFDNQIICKRRKGRYLNKTETTN